MNTKKQIYQIKSIYAVNDRKAIVELCNMRADLQLISLPYNEVKNWFGEDKDNYSIQFEIRKGQQISADLCTKTRTLSDIEFL